MNKLERLVTYPTMLLGLSSVSCLVEGEISSNHTSLSLTRFGAFVIGGAVGYFIGHDFTKKNKDSSGTNYKK